MSNSNSPISSFLPIEKFTEYPTKKKEMEMAKAKEKVKKDVIEKAKSLAKKTTPADPAIVHVRDLSGDLPISISGGPRSKMVHVKCGDQMVGDIASAVVVMLLGDKIEATCEYHPPDSKNPALREKKKEFVEALDVLAVVREIKSKGWDRPKDKASKGEVYAPDLPENALVRIVSPADPAHAKVTYGRMIVRGISSLRITIGGGGLAMRNKVFLDCQLLKPEGQEGAEEDPQEVVT